MAIWQEPSGVQGPLVHRLSFIVLWAVVVAVQLKAVVAADQCLVVIPRAGPVD